MITLRDLLENGTVEGYIKIQCWENEDNPAIYPTIYYEGNNCGDLEEYFDREITYIFPYNKTPNEAAICIELAEI